MHSQTHEHQIQSDNDEGFIPSKIIIKQKQQIHLKKDKAKIKPLPTFVPRYITEGIMRKQPPQCYKRFSKFDYVEESINTQQQIDEQQHNSTAQSQQTIEINQVADFLSMAKIKTRQKLLTPYDKYVVSGDFILVYSRYKDFKFSNEQPNFAANQVRLDCLRSTEELKFKQIKPFQVIVQRRQSVLTQQMNRNGSVRQSLLQFDSKFECGNLLCAYKHKKQPYTYTLFIQNDTNSYGYNQWFYFSIRNAEIKAKYKFNIVNFRKRNSFFRQGNRPIIFSLADSKKPGMSGYSKRGENVIYGKSPICKSYNNKQKFYQLSFELQFYHPDDICYISMGLPYSYSKLLNNLAQYEVIAKQNGIKYDFESIGTSIAGNSVPYISITKMDDFDKSLEKDPSLQQASVQPSLNRQTSQQQSCKSQKRVILVMGRQHPGETWSSYLMDELILNLVSRNTPQCNYLLSNFIIKCIPMVNVDGVISGNFRCDLSGMDLNRIWKTPSSLLHPQVLSIKNQVSNLVSVGYKVETCLDLHGHSKQYNVFCYSCKIDNVQCRVLPFIFSEINSEFHFPFCTFGISKYKQSTARAVIFNIIKNTNVLTIESSFFGSKLNGKLEVFQPESFDKMADTLLKGCKSYLSNDQRAKICRETVKLRMPQFQDFKGEKQDAFSGSDSEPSADEMDLEEKLEKIVPKNLIKQCIDAHSSKKSYRRTKKNLNRKTLQLSENRSFKVKNSIMESPSKNYTIDYVKEQSLAKQTKSNWDTIKIKKKSILQHNRTSHFKKPSILVSNQLVSESQSSDLTKKINLKDIIEREEQKLPFFNREKPSLIPIKLKNESFQIFKDAYNATEKYIKSNNQSSIDDIRNQRRPSKKIGIFKQARDKQLEEFPLLCVLSENKKKTHVEKIKQRRQSQNTNLEKDQKAPQKVKTAIQTRTQAIKKLREKDKNSMELVSKIWRQNFTRYGMAFSTFKITK